MATLKQLKEQVDSLIASRGEDGAIAYALWHPLDVSSYASDIDTDITDAEAVDVIHAIHDGQSPEYGITYDSISSAIDNVTEARED